MAYNIEQDNESVKLAHALQVRADIQSVRIAEATLESKTRPEEVESPLSVRLKFHAENGIVTGRKLEIPVRFGFRASEKEKTYAVAITARLQADYELVEGYEPTRDEIDAFRRGNAIFNCWPYFREFVQGALARMNYPPFTLPFLRLVPKPQRGAKSPKDRTRTTDPSSSVEPGGRGKARGRSGEGGNENQEI